MITLYYITAILFFAASVHISLYSIEQFYLYLSSRRHKQETPPSMTDDEWPFVTIQLPMYNEQFVVKNLIECICQMDYPASKLEIQILDDSTDQTTDIIRQILQNKQTNLNIQLLHRNNRTGYKAGALREGLERSNGEFIAIFDADFRPHPDFLRRTIPFFKDEKIAAVQTRWGHINEDHSFITKVQGILINNHFLVEQQGRYAGGHMLQFSGTAGVWRKKVISEAGGWQSDTIIEDVDLSIRTQLKNWKIKLLPDVVCPAELPSDVNAVKVQQFRWMQGGAQVSRKHLLAIWKSGMNLSQKYHTTMHLTTAYIYLSILLSALLSLPMLWAIPALEINIASLGILSFGFLLIVIVLFMPNYQVGWAHLQKKKRILRFILLFPSLVISGMAISFHNSVAIFKGTFGIKTPFKRTPKYNFTETGQPAAHKNNTYRIKASWIAWAELALVFYFIYALWVGITIKNLVFVAYHFSLIIVFAIISFLSLNFNFDFSKNQESQ